MGPQGRPILQRLANANKEANPELLRIALKLATGAGKTTVMAMIIAWQTINAVRRPQSVNFTRGFLVVAPGITIRDRLRVLQPNDPDSYYNSRELVPADMLEDLKRAKIVITNYHAFMLRERMQLSKVGRELLQGREDRLNTLETEGQMIQRVMPDLMNLKNILVMNDEGHHCYRRKPGDEDEANLKGEDRQEAKKNNEAARVWINGLETIKRKVGVSQVIDLSATPFFLRGSGYHEGTLFPWTASDFSLMDAIECGIVKLPRVPVADNIPGGNAPMYRFLWDEIRPDMPKKGRGKSAGLDPLSLPLQLQTALEALYGHYKKTFELWQDAEIPVPPCFVIVCNNTSTSKLVFDYVSGFHRQNEDGSTSLVEGKLDLFSNFDGFGNPLSRPNTVLIDSQQLESGEALDSNFRKMAAQEIDQYRREIIERTGDRSQADNISDQDLLREVMNTVGKEDRLGGSIRCVVSVSMLTEGWDANTVTHILGVRAFGTQLLCEQVVGRALRRYSYELNEEGLFDAEYADVLGVPFDFTARPVVAPPHKPPPTVQVIAVSPERDHLEIRFPRVAGYRVDLPKEQLSADFNQDSVLELTPKLIGPSHTTNAGIIGESVDLNLVHTNDLRRSTLLFNLTTHLLNTKWRDAGAAAELHLFGRLKRITNQWLNQCLVCKGDAYPAQLMFEPLADMACERIAAAITRTNLEGNSIKALLDPYNPVGSTRFVNFRTSKALRWRTDPRKCHVNWVILDSDWETEFCRVAEQHPRVRRLRQEPQPRPHRPLQARLGQPHVHTRLHRPGRRRPRRRRRRPPEPGRGDQRLPRRRCQREEDNHGDLLGAGCKRRRRVRPLGLRRVHRRVRDRGGFRSQSGSGFQQNNCTKCGPIVLRGGRPPVDVARLGNGYKLGMACPSPLSTGSIATIRAMNMKLSPTAHTFVALRREPSLPAKSRNPKRKRPTGLRPWKVPWPV